MSIATLTIILLLLLPIGGIILQVYLSKQESKWLGLILPSITLLYSLVMLLSAVFVPNTSAWEFATMLIGIFLLSNIPTAVLLIIYFACREKRRRRAQIAKMNIQDLE